MKKLLLIALLVICASVAVSAQTTNSAPIITETNSAPAVARFTFNNVTPGNLVATMTTASTETPSNGSRFWSLTVVPLPSGDFNIIAIYR